MYKVAKEEWGYSKLDNLITKVKLEYKDIQRDRRLKDGELDLILAEAATRKNKLISPIISWAVHTGMRRGEVMAMKWEHINIKDRLLLIPETKNGYSRTLPLTKEMMAVLESLDPTEDRVFPINANTFAATWHKMLTKLGLNREIRFHDLRREAVSTFFERGLGIQEVASLSGHRTWSQLKRYTEPRPQDILRKLEPALA
jgi:integrase